MIMSTKISIIAAIGKNRELGKDNQLLWHIPEDLKRFKKLTLNHPVIMGRTTYESLGKPLPDRTNIVVSRNQKLKIKGCQIANSLEEAINKAKMIDRYEIFIIGGGQIYREAINLADRLYLTIINASSPADTFFPDYSGFKKIISSQKGNSQNLMFTFRILEKTRDQRI